MRPEPTAPVVAPKDTPETVFESPASTSVSLASTPEATGTVSVTFSATVPTSTTAAGASLAPVIVTVSVVVEVAPAASRTVYEKESVSVLAAVRSAWTAARALLTV